MVNKFDKKMEVKRECPECGAGFTFTTFVDFPNFGPTHCDDCVKKQTAELEAKERKRNLLELVESAKIHERYKQWDHEEATRRGSDKILSWLTARQNESVWIPGAHGIGKTHTMLYATYRRILKTGKAAYIIEAVEWFDKVVSLKFNDDYRAKKRGENMERWALKVAHLVIDDLGKEGANGLTSEKAKLYQRIIDHREKSRLVTWVSTNLSGQEFENHCGANYGPAIMARLGRLVPPSNVYNK